MHFRRILGLRSLAAAGLLLAAQGAGAEALNKPDHVAVEPGAQPRFLWAGVDEAGLYRVAVFDAPDAEGKRLLLAAVWVSGTAWTYGAAPSVQSAAHLPSTRPLPLPAGHKVRVMVAAARADGTDKSDWSGADFKVAVPAGGEPALEPTASPSPTAVAAQGVSPSSDAELDLSGNDEFKTSPDPAVIDVQDNTKNAAAADGSATAASAASPTAAADAADAASGASGTAPADSAADSTDPQAAAKAMLAAGKYEDAEAAFRALLDQNAKNAAAWEGLGDSYAGRSMKVEAASAYEKALQLNADNERLKDWMQKNVRY
jgi:hypothetical protein